MLTKFPRTPHLAALGSGVTRDDLVMDSGAAAYFLAHSRLVIEEKVDGTNLGISFHGPTFQLHLQHRGRRICPGGEIQYAKLQHWLDRRMAHLIEALGTRYVLYGEWLAARHSVAYSRLPDLFLAFDVLDTTAGRFLCKAERDVILRKAHVWPVRCIAEGALLGGLAELTMMLLNTNSLYCEGQVPVEGLYIRQEGASSSGTAAARAAPARIGNKAAAKKGGNGAAGSSAGAPSKAAAAPQGCWLLARAKLVHPNFSQALAEGDGRHWSTRFVTETNTARPDLWLEQPWHEDEAIAGAEQGSEASGSSPAGAAAAAAAATQPSENVADVVAAPQQTASTGGGSSPGSGSPEAPKQRPTDRPEQPAAAASSASGNSSAGKARAGKSATVPGASWQQCRLCLAGSAVAVKGAAVDDVAACYLGRVPAAAVEKRRSRFGTSFHISLFSPAELPQVRAAAASSSSASLSGPGLELLQLVQELLRDDEAPSASSAGSRAGSASSCQLGSWVPLGLGRLAAAPAGSAAYFVAVTWPAAQQLRRLLGLPDKDFHITLGFEGADVHAGGKGLSSLVMPVMATSEPDCAAAGTAGSTVASRMSRLLDSLPAQAGTASQQQAECVLAAVNQCTSGGRDGSRAPMRLVCSTLLLAALQCVDGGGRSSGWEELGTLCLAAAQAGIVQASSGTSGSAHGCSSTPAAALALLAWLAGRNGDLAACVQLATTAADEAIAGAAAGAGAYAQLLLGKALFQQGDAAAALAAFGEARKAVAGRATSTMAGDGQGPEGADAAAAAAAASWLDGALLQMVNGAVLDKAIRACSAAKDPPAPAVAAGRGDPVPLALSDPRQKFTVRDVPQVGDVTMMRNTSWLIPGRLMGASTPTSREHIAALSHLGVSLVVTLTEEGPLPPDWFSSASSEGGKGPAGRAAAGVAGITNVLVPVTNYEAPTAAQMDLIMSLAESTWAGSTADSSSSSSSSSSRPAAAVMVHCGGGKGRAGTVLACLLCKHGTASWHDAGTGTDEASKEPAMSSTEAIKWLRQQRPGSIETEQQERFVAEYCSLLWQRCSWAGASDAGLPAGASSSAGSVASEAGDDSAVGKASGSSSNSSIAPLPQQQLPRLIICVGLPGSGKSTFAQALAAAGGIDDASGSTGSGTSSKWQQQRGGVWQRVCQDECGGRSAAEAAFSNAVLRGRSRVVLDRCNATAADRAEWLSLALLRSNKRGKLLSGVWAVHFDVAPETCIARVAARSDHPTIPQGRGRRAVESFAATLEPPTRAEGFERVVTVSTPQEVDKLLLLLLLGPSVG